MQETEFILKNKAGFLKYLKTKFTIIHMSNFFFRDLHYGALSYLNAHKMKSTYGKAEKIAHEVASEFEKNGIFKRIDYQSWLVNYPEFALPRIEKKAS